MEPHTLNQTINWLRTEPAYDPTSRLTQLDNTTITYNARGLPDTITTTDPAGTTTQTRDYNGDGLLTDITITEPDTTTTTHHLTWNTLQPVPQILAITTNGQTTNYLYGNQREALINPDNTSALFAHDHHGNTLTTPATTNHTTAKDFDPYGNPTNGTDPTRIGFGYQGELHIGPTIHLRNRDYLPQHQTFTTTDPLANVPGTPTTSNPYHYANNTPTNLNDPLGLRPTDRTFRSTRGRTRCNGCVSIPGFQLAPLNAETGNSVPPSARPPAPPRPTVQTPWLPTGPVLTGSLPTGPVLTGDRQSTPTFTLDLCATYDPATSPASLARACGIRTPTLRPQRPTQGPIQRIPANGSINGNPVRNPQRPIERIPANGSITPVANGNAGQSIVQSITGAASAAWPWVQRGFNCVVNGAAVMPAGAVAGTFAGTVAPGAGNIVGGGSGAAIGFAAGCVYGAASPDPVTGLGG